MAMVINTNVASLNAQRNLSTTSSAAQNALQRLSSGLRINTAKDDAAGLAISTRMNAQIKSLNQGIRNANDAISMIQTAEGGLSELQNMMTRIRELAVQASSDTVGSTERGYIDTELQELLSEMNNIANRTKFNGNALLTGALATTLDATGTVTNGLQVGAASVTNIDVSGAAAGKTFTLSYAAGTDTLTLSDGTNSQDLTLLIMAADSSQTLNFSGLGVSLTLSSVAGDAVDTIGAALATKTVITSAGSAAATFQVGADYDSNNQVSVSFEDATVVNGNADAGIDGLADALATFTGAKTAANAGALLSAVDDALDSISTMRASYGAAQNRLTNAVSNLQATSENLAAAKSQVTDADFAAETAALTRAQVLQQAGTAMLAQANSAPNQVLALLRNLG
ncbi:MAG: flagellin [Betaproteobacteria bacterium]|nr:flagellin [Betaproteobacteria bacterium]